MITCVKTIRGSALIAIIAAILIFSVLAASLIPMIGSSSRQAAISALGDRAYFLAESGYRFLDGQYRNPGLNEFDRNTALEALDDETFTLRNEELDEEGQFYLRVYSYFYPITVNASAGQLQITTNPPGRLPLDDDQDENAVYVDSNARLSISGKLYRILAGNLTQEGDITFSINGLQEEIPLGTTAYPAALSAATPPLTIGGNLNYQDEQGGLFPLRNGRVLVDNHLILDYRYNNRGYHRFEGINYSDEYGPNPVINAGSPIVLNNYARVHVVGSVGGAKREVVYYNALPLSASAISPQREEYTFDDGTPNKFSPANTDTTSIDIGSVDGSGNQALRITGSDGNALLKLDAEVTEKAFDFYRRSTGGYLSYDVQVKVGFYGLWPSPYFINPIPLNDVAAGLSFRISNIIDNISYNGYGLSFVRGGISTLSGIIPAEEHGQPLIMLWYQTGNANTRQWLAYKRLVRPIEINGVWTIPPSWLPVESLREEGALAWRYNGTSNDELITPQISLGCIAEESPCQEGPRIILRFWTQPAPNTDLRKLTLLLESGEQIHIVTITPDWVYEIYGWHLVTADITNEIRDIGAEKIQLRFTPNAGEELSIDNVQLFYQWPVHNSTLAVRLQEAAMVRFNNFSGTEPFNVGTRIYGDGGTLGTVISIPVLSNDTWDSTTTGILLLNQVTPKPTAGSNLFSSGERIRALGTDSVAYVATYNNDTDAITNTIKVYYASREGAPHRNTENGNLNPFDAITLAYPRREINQNLQWPVKEGAEWTEGQDYFQLIQWDAVNEDSSIENRVESITDYIIRHYNANLQSQEYTSGGVSELGLHAYGSASNIYFDDFGYQLVLPPLWFYATPLQQ